MIESEGRTPLQKFELFYCEICTYFDRKLKLGDDGIAEYEAHLLNRHGLNK